MKEIEFIEPHVGAERLLPRQPTTAIVHIDTKKLDNEEVPFQILLQNRLRTDLVVLAQQQDAIFVIKRTRQRHSY